VRSSFGPVRWILLLLFSAGVACGTPAAPTLQQIADDFDRELAPTPNDRWPLVRLAEVQLEKGDARASVKSCREALSRYGKDSLGRGRALLVLSRAQLALKEHSLSVAALDLILRDGPKELAGEAQLQKGLIESEFLLTPGRFLTVLRRLSLENPLTLDFDMLRYMVGTERGYRLDRIDVALSEFKKAWKNFPKGAPASEALLHQALLEGLVLSRTDVASHLVDTLAENYPNARVVPVARVLQATLMMAKGRYKLAAKALAEVGDDSPVIREAVYLQALCTSYYLDDPRTGLGLFESMEKHPGSSHWTRVARYHRALITFAVRQEPAEALQLLDQRDDSATLKGEELASAQRFDQYGQQLRELLVFPASLHSRPEGTRPVSQRSRRFEVGTAGADAPGQDSPGGYVPAGRGSGIPGGGDGRKHPGPQG
jgi:tetratricopeptide (TPR) repeat protein